MVEDNEGRLCDWCCQPLPCPINHEQDAAVREQERERRARVSPPEPPTYKYLTIDD